LPRLVLCSDGRSRSGKTMDHNYFVYVLTDKGRSTLYIGVTNDMATRLWQHRNPEQASFSQRYHCILLVHIEHTTAM